MRHLLALAVLLLDLWAILSVLGSRASVAGKLVWILIILLFPVLGFLAWFFLGPKAGVAANV